ncbi:MAG TPA: VWA domain-containing protein [Gemmatimonadales bacterium]|nr:VWA domain-containing protein [Gemmatimonadales bacterium]
MTFAHPFLLVLLLLLPAGAALGIRAERRRRAALARFGDPALLDELSAIPDARRRLARHLLRLAALALLVVALARPQLGQHPALIARAGRDVLVLLDLSRSMNVADAAGGTRLAAAKRIADSLAAASPGDRLGLVVFGGSAFLQLPLTDDHDAFRRFVEAAGTDDVGDPSTDIAAPLAAAAKAFEHEGEAGTRAAVLLSDGESAEDGLDVALGRLEREGVPVLAIGVGTAQGGPVPADSSEAPEPYHRDHIGRVVISHLEEGTLRRAAERTGGAYAAWDDPAGLRSLGETLARIETRPIGIRKARKPAERFQWPLAISVLLLLVEGAVPLAARRKRGGLLATRPPVEAAAALVLLAALLAGCSSAAWDARRAEREYDAGDWAGAYQAFEQALDAAGNPVFAFNAGNALYRQKHYDKAAGRWRGTLGEARFRQRSAYNLGNAAVRSAEDATGPAKDSLLDAAVAAYEDALRLDPRDRDAKWNLEIALRRRGERPGGSSSGHSRHGDYGQGNQNVPGFQGNQEAAVGAMAGGGFGSGGDGESVKELDQTEARQLLDAVQREQLATHLGRRASHPTSGGKDW